MMMMQLFSAVIFYVVQVYVNGRLCLYCDLCFYPIFGTFVELVDQCCFNPSILIVLFSFSVVLNVINASVLVCCDCGKRLHRSVN